MHGRHPEREDEGGGGGASPRGAAAAERVAKDAGEAYIAWRHTELPTGTAIAYGKRETQLRRMALTLCVYRTIQLRHAGKPPPPSPTAVTLRNGVATFVARGTTRVDVGGAGAARRVHANVLLLFVNQMTVDAALDVGTWDREFEGTPRVAVLDMANARHPGGGWAHGAIAQEETLCMRTDLLRHLYHTGPGRPWLLAQHRVAFIQRQDLVPNSHYPLTPGSKMLIAHDVEVLVPGADALVGMREPDFMDTVFADACAAAAAADKKSHPRIDVLVAAAPNMRGARAPADPRGVLARTARMVVAAAVHTGCTHLVLGAHGCGAFGNDYDMVATAYRDAIYSMDLGNIRAICFAIYASTHDMRMTWAFRNILTRCAVTQAQ